MASPQTENGYFKIANEVFEALCAIRIPGEARQVLDTVIRKTWGYGKKEDYISLSQFSLSTKMSKIAIIKAIKKLNAMNLLITQKGNTNGNSYLVNKDFDTWNPLPKKVTLPKKAINVTQKGNTSLPKKVHTKDNDTKDTFTKDNGAPPPKKKKVEINGEAYRGKSDPAFDAFLDYCKGKNVRAAIMPKRYFALRDEYQNRVVWWNEVKGCINWLFDNELIMVNAQRLRNRMEMAIKIAADRTRQQQQNYSDKKFAPQKVIKFKREDEEHYLECAVCGNVMTNNPDGICTSCAQSGDETLFLN